MPPKSRTKRKAAPSASTIAAKRAKNGNTNTTVGRTANRRSKVAHNMETAPIKSPATPPPGPNTPAYLDALPDELLLCVLEQLDAQFLSAKPRVNQFQSICLTNRRLNRLSNNFLYSDFNARLWPHPTKFLRTIIANSELANCVKSMNWSFEMLDHATKDKFMPSSADRRGLRESLKSMGIGGRADLEEEYNQGFLSQLFKLALMHTPNLRALIIDDGTPSFRYISRQHYQDKSYMQLLRNAANGTPDGLAPVYPHLQELDLRVGDMLLDDVLSVFRLPSLRKLILDGINGTRHDPSQDLLTSLSNTSSVIDLAITNSFLDTKTVIHLIAACRELRKFHFVYNSRTYVFPLPKVSYTDLGKALQKHKKSLEVLSLDDESDRTLHIITDYDRGVLGSLRDFENLIYFGAPMEAFEPLNDPPPDIAESLEHPDDYIPFARLANVLPKSLHHLVLTIFEDEELSDLCSESLNILHETYHDDLPRLHDIEIKAHRLVYMKSVDFWTAKHKFESSGVSFRISQDGVLEEDIAYSSDEDTVTDSELYDSLDEFGGFEDEMDEIEELFGFDDLDGFDDDEGEDVGAHDLETLLDVMDGIQEASQGVDAAMASVMPLLASLQAGHLQHHLQHHHLHQHGSQQGNQD